MKEPPGLEDPIRTIRGKVERMNVGRIRQEDITASGGGAPDEEGREGRPPRRAALPWPI